MNSKISIYISIAFLALLLLISCEKDLIQHDVEVELEEAFENHDLPSLSVGIYTRDGMVYSKFMGHANNEDEIEASHETIYHIGSISKLFIVTAVMQLEEEGLLELDEDISTYLPFDLRHPDFPDIPITTRMLLTHTTGLSWPGSFNSQQGMWNNFPADEGPAPSEWIPQYLIPSGSQFDAHLWKPLEPGKHERYSNIGTCVAAYIVEQISGKNFRDYCKEHIFEPLDMHNTSYNYADLDLEKIALLYDKNGNPSTYYDNRTYAAGGVKSTLHDLSNFASCYLNNGLYEGTQILSKASINNILEVQNPASGKCLMWNKYLGGWYGHEGGLDIGTATTFAIHIESKIAMIIFTNTSNAAVHPGGEIYWLLRQKANEYIEH